MWTVSERVEIKGSNNPVENRISTAFTSPLRFHIVSTSFHITYFHIVNFIYRPSILTLLSSKRFMLPSTPTLQPKPKPTTQKTSYLRQTAPPLPTLYATILQNHPLYQPELGTLEAHCPRHNARTNIFHRENKDLPREG